MKFVGDCSEEHLKVVGVVCDRGRGIFVPLVRVSIYCGGEHAELLVQLIFELLHDLGEVFLGEDWVGVCDIAHGLDFLRDCLFHGCLC